MVTRNIHLEKAKDISAIEFLHAFRRFVARRGTPELMISDNGTNFQAASTILENKIVNENNEELTNFLLNKQIKWIFNTPASPWRGGMFERMMRIIKETMYKTIGKRVLNETEMSTLIAEIEAIANSRPLTYIGTESDQVILRPIDFLIPEIPIELELTSIEGIKVNAINTTEQAQRTFMFSNQYRDQLWKNWNDHYLTSLRTEREVKMHQEKSTNKKPKKRRDRPSERGQYTKKQLENCKNRASNNQC